MMCVTLCSKDGGIEDIKIPLVSDMKKEISRDYDVLIDEAGIALR
jgi:alkyl hydroperoxide reductase subunit AhpC